MPILLKELRHQPPPQLVVLAYSSEVLGKVRQRHRSVSANFSHAHNASAPLRVGRRYHREQLP
jgi:hypothetical protein